MPQLQVLSPYEDNQEPSGVEKFFSNVSKVYRDEIENKQVTPIWEEYLKNADDADNYRKTRVALDKNNKISPTRRAQEMKNLDDMEKVIIEKDKALNAKAKELSPYEKKLQEKESEEMASIPQKLNEYESLISDLKELRSLTDKASTVLPGVWNPELSSRYNALQSELTIKSASLLKGTASDKDMALLLRQTGSIGDVGGVKVYDRLIKKAEQNAQTTNKRGQELSNKYAGRGGAEKESFKVQPTVDQVQENLFKGKSSSEFSRPDGSKVKVSKGNDKQMISALSQGYAPPGYIAMLAPDGYPDAVPVDEVQNELNNGSIIIYGY